MDRLGGHDPDLGPASSVITATSLGKSFNNVLKAEPPPRIRVINEVKLKEMRSRRSRQAYLDHPVYTPRQDLILVDSLWRLGRQGRDAYLQAAMAAADEPRPTSSSTWPRSCAATRKTGPITGITMVGPLPVAQTKRGAAVIPFALDYGV